MKRKHVSHQPRALLLFNKGSSAPSSYLPGWFSKFAKPPRIQRPSKGEGLESMFQTVGQSRCD